MPNNSLIIPVCLQNFSFNRSLSKSSSTLRQFLNIDHRRVEGQDQLISFPDEVILAAEGILEVVLIYGARDAVLDMATLSVSAAGCWLDAAPRCGR